LKTAQEQRIVPWNQNRGESDEDESEVDDVFSKRVGEVDVSNEVVKSRLETPPLSDDEFFEDSSPIKPKTNLRLRNSTFLTPLSPVVSDDDVFTSKDIQRPFSSKPCISKQVIIQNK
jgi:hypothetical protein